MGEVVAETQNQTAVVVDNNNNTPIKDKKKNRRSRRSKQISPPTVGTASSSLTVCLGESDFKGDVPILDHEGSKELSLPRASNIAFTSLPTMHFNEQAAESESLPVQLTMLPGVGGQIYSGSCPDPIVYGDPPITSYPQRKYFASHWPAEAVHKALERGHIFKALFRVNAHNRLEAYCKIDGVRADVLISGPAVQNRAVEGDIVAIEVDPPSLWTKMKGYTAGVENSALVDDGMLESDNSEFVRENCKGKNKVAADFESSSCGNCSSPLENAVCNRSGQSFGEVSNPEEKVPVENVCVNGHNLTASKPSIVGCSSEMNDALHATERLSVTVNSFPSKRPTGRVVAILEGSPRRDTITGFLSVKKWMWSREGYKRDSKKNRHLSTALSCQYLLLTPNDPRFPKMMVPFKSLPDFILKRLEAGDVTLEMDLVAARIADWAEENYIPEAHVTDIFGRGGEVEPQLAAILFENAIDSSEFSQEALSCLPSIPWEIPKEELQSRRDIRNFCVFTIDPASATDLDDALSVERLSDGNFRVGVHIADVSYFVLPDSALDENARAKSTSVYLLQSKLPMLPPLLSENLGSLNPGVDKLAFSIFWDISLTGEVSQRWIGRTIIQSCCKLSYEHAQDIIDGLLDDPSSYKGERSWPVLHGLFKWSDVVTSVKNLYEISKILKKKRFDDGALSLESPKIVFLFDKEGIPYDSVLSVRKESNFLVEEFMLLANRTAAEVITRAYPSSALLRRHPEPNLRKLREFESFCSKHGLRLDTSSSGQFHNSLERIRQELTDDSVLLDILMSYASRPMQLATYFCSGDVEDENDRGHYALAVPLYTHFTSPLRRYPDILVHRMLAAALEAEEAYLKLKLLHNPDGGEMTRERCLTSFDKDAIGSPEAQEALSAAASKHKVPCAKTLAGIASHCNERKLASRHVKDAMEKLYMWVLLKGKEVLFSEARVMGLGPRFMSLYIHKLATEQRIYYDEVEGLTVEWLEATSTLVLSPSTNKRFNRRGSPGKCRSLEDVALIVSPCELNQELDLCGLNNREGSGVLEIRDASKSGLSCTAKVEPAVFPVTLRLLSTITVALHAIGGGNGPLDIGVRLFISSYFR
ncbi:PREDICTED: DIS3-like exonuclease 2 [Nicotiana attenuata]|uniref:DIS3-like exonuclease 2 n=1 Tax=Nicotiana attenuata TaxID=49451 RepID=UPI000904F8D5|nr:PREDICTED: DIS3-like exonuclease 2 [Nicotiana attenuata]